MTKTEIIAYHGWAFDAACWQNMQALIEADSKWMNFDRGYFGEPQSPVFSKKEGKKIVITHSFGLHQCSDQILAAADLLVIISGFLTFHPQKAQFRERSKRVVNEMINQFGDQPDNVLHAFYRNVFHPQKSFKLPPEEKRQSLLMDDLKWLNLAEKTVPDLKKSAKVCILHGTEDAIVPRQKGRKLTNHFNSQAQYFEIKGAGHALPMTHAEKCRQIMNNTLADLRNG